MRAARFTAAAVGMLLAVAGCGGGPIPAEEFTVRYAEALCASAGRCQTLAPYLVRQCEDGRRALLGEDVAAALAAGRIEYDPEAARRCVDALAQAPCFVDRLSDVSLAACFAALQGQVPPGEPCGGFFECAAGVCGGAEPVECPTRCPEVLGEDEACSPLGALACDARAGLVCSAGRCVRPGAVGQPCEDNVGCTTGTVCVAGGCVPLRTRGQGCSSSASCAAGLYCLALSTDPGSCEPRVAERGLCAQTVDEILPALGGAQCAEGLSCVGAGLDRGGEVRGGACARVAGEGARCTPQPSGLQVFVTGCEVGLLCTDAGRCALPPTEGACGAHSLCKGDVATCEPSGNTCVPLGEDGAACGFAVECRGGACLGGRCAPRIAACLEG